jgi:hypothetical protein
LLPQFVSARAGVGYRVFLLVAWGLLRRFDARILIQYSLLEALQGQGGIDAKLFLEELASSLIGPEGIGLPSGPVKGEHLELGHSLSKRVLPYQCLELTDYPLMIAQRELGFESGLHRHEPELVETCYLRGKGRLPIEVPVWLAVPELEGLPQQLHGRCGVGAAGGVDQLLEAKRVE